MNCCNNFSQCTRGANCPALKPDFICAPMHDKSPQKEVTSDAVYFLGFIALVVVICATAGFVWAILQHFAPDFVHMLQYLFS